MSERARVIRLTETRAADVARLWRRCFPCRELHAHIAWNPSGGPVTAGWIRRRILARDGFDPAGAFVAVSGGRAVGFCVAAMAGGTDARDGYLGALAVDPRWRGQGLGTRLIGMAERYLAQRGAQNIRTGFEGHPMPLLLGVPADNDACTFFLNRGYRSYDRNLMQVMVQDTARFRLPESFAERLRRLAAQGVALGPLDPQLRRSLMRLLAKRFQGWHAGIARRLERDPNTPLLVAARRNVVVGFAGPYSVGPKGAGHFFAIGVAPETRGQGIGVALFLEMSAALQAAGAHTTSLTTNLNNAAQEIYARAGYRARCVADCNMRKSMGEPGQAGS